MLQYIHRNLLIDPIRFRNKKIVTELICKYTYNIHIK